LIHRAALIFDGGALNFHGGTIFFHGGDIALDRVPRQIDRFQTNLDGGTLNFHREMLNFHREIIQHHCDALIFDGFVIILGCGTLISHGGSLFCRKIAKKDRPSRSILCQPPIYIPSEQAITRG
jgi:hypothetical protein